MIDPWETLIIPSASAEEEDRTEQYSVPVEVAVSISCCHHDPPIGANEPLSIDIGRTEQQEIIITTTTTTTTPMTPAKHHNTVSPYPEPASGPNLAQCTDAIGTDPREIVDTPNLSTNTEIISRIAPAEEITESEKEVGPIDKK